MNNVQAKTDWLIYPGNFPDIDETVLVWVYTGRHERGYYFGSYDGSIFSIESYGSIYSVADCYWQPLPIPPSSCCWQPLPIPPLPIKINNS